jgi:hypothetical protein
MIAQLAIERQVVLADHPEVFPRSGGRGAGTWFGMKTGWSLISLEAQSPLQQTATEACSGVP